MLFITGTVPTFSGGSSPISISESLTVGSSVTVVSLTDDFGDQFMFSDLGNPYFEINQTTGIQKWWKSGVFFQVNPTSTIASVKGLKDFFVCILIWYLIQISFRFACVYDTTCIFFLMYNETFALTHLKLFQHIYFIGLISLMTSLPVTGVETPYFLTMSVMDSCFNTASIAINITTFVQVMQTFSHC